MPDKKQAGQVMMEIAEKYGYDLEDEAELRQVGRIMMDEHKEFRNLFTEDLVAIRESMKKN